MKLILGYLPDSQIKQKTCHVLALAEIETCTVLTVDWTQEGAYSAYSLE